LLRAGNVERAFEMGRRLDFIPFGRQQLDFPRWPPE
jgi:hypothetical protein